VTTTIAPLARARVARTRTWPSPKRALLALFTLVARALAPVTWRTPARAAEKLRGFSATERGSARDMLRAAWLERDPARRRLFFVHALDEHRHADLFADAARAISPADTTDARVLGERRASARLMDLYRAHGLTGFLAFVEDAEERGRAHFEALARHMESGPKGALDDDARARLSALFRSVAHDEHFHVQYSGRLLARAGGRSATALAARARALGAAWRRSGRALVERFVDVALTAFVALVFPIFALAFVRERALAPALDDRAPQEEGRALVDERAALRSQL